MARNCLDEVRSDSHTRRYGDGNTLYVRGEVHIRMPSHESWKSRIAVSTLPGIFSM